MVRYLGPGSLIWVIPVQTLGVMEGDRVAYYMANSPELIVSFYGILKAGSVAIPCNSMYKARELKIQLLDAQPKVIICDEELYPFVEKVKDSLAPVAVIVNGTISGEYSMEDLVSLHSPIIKSPRVDPDHDLALLPYTGGTTGVPKGAALTHRNLVTNAVQFASWYGYGVGTEVFISALSLFHIGGIAGAMSVPVSVGGTMVLFRRFHPQGVLRAVQRYKATRFVGVPTMYIAILGLSEARNYNLDSLSQCRTGAAPLPGAVKEAFDELVGHEVLVEGYGLTEAGPLTHANPVHRTRAGSIGTPLPDTEARIVSQETADRTLSPGEVGELVIRGPQIMSGYWNKLTETQNSIQDGWLYTGDIARMDDDGYFYIVGRKSDVINAGGFKVWPREVEEVLYRHQNVKMAAVVGVPDEYRGETVKAALVLKDGQNSNVKSEFEIELIAWCRKNLAAYKVPRIFEFLESLPTSPSGKIFRRSLKDN